ncbi:MAG: 50S ribosomal protein L18 [Patescibacteria group bacterium]|nr:50S ribosomal protein L18 [Patescibacteria group bacterium]
MNIKNKKQYKMERRHKRIRAKIAGTTERPRLSVFKSHKYIFVQLIDDEKGVTLVSAWSKGMKGKPAERARAVGAELAKKAVTAKISQVVFDRGGYLYAGHIKEVADGARDGGLKF